MFQDEDYRHGSVCSSDLRVRRKAIAHMKECVGIAKETFHELVSGAAKVRPGCEIAYTIDESPILKPRIEAMIQSVMNIQEAYAKALIVDRKALRRAQDEHRIVDAERVLWEAFMTDVTPMLAKGRIAKGLDPDPLASHRKSGYYEKIRKARAGKGKAAAGLGTG